MVVNTFPEGYKASVRPDDLVFSLAENYCLDHSTDS